MLSGWIQRVLTSIPVKAPFQGDLYSHYRLLPFLCKFVIKYSKQLMINAFGNFCSQLFPQAQGHRSWAGALTHTWKCTEQPTQELCHAVKPSDNFGYMNPPYLKLLTTFIFAMLNLANSPLIILAIRTKGALINLLNFWSDVAMILYHFTNLFQSGFSRNVSEWTNKLIQ